MLKEFENERKTEFQQLLCFYLPFNFNLKLDCDVLPPFQIIRRFGFSRYIVFAMHLDIHNV
jgi:hypothetical protein